MDLYIVEALRWGSRENHSYVVGVFTTLEKANEIKEKHEDYRGGKYECSVLKYELDKEDQIEEDNKKLSEELKKINKEKGIFKEEMIPNSVIIYGANFPNSNNVVPTITSSELYITELIEKEKNEKNGK